MTTNRRTEELTASQAARALGMTAQSLGRWGAKPGAPVRLAGSRVYYRWPDFPKWRDEQQAAKRREKPADFEEARARKMAAEAELAEIELSKARAEVVSVADVAREYSERLDRIRARIVALTGRLAPLVVGVPDVSEATVLIEPAIFELLTDLSHGRSSH